MIARLIFCSILFFVISSIPILCSSSEKDPPIYSLPITEISDLVTDWLTGSGFQVEKIKTVQEQIRINGISSHGTWEVSLEPRSALSTAVRVKYSSFGTGPNSPHDLYDYLQQYTAGSLKGTPLQTTEIPSAVRERTASTVCLHSAGHGESIESSGFFIDKKLILSTAHGLNNDQEITVATSSGIEFKGSILKLDPARDLALIKIRTDSENFIPLETGRNLLAEDDIIYSIGCPFNIPGKIYGGTVNGTPRRIGRYPFWMAHIEVQPGSSGSPVFNKQGVLVAVIKGRYRGTDTTGFLIPLQTIMDFLNDYLTK
jgi:serine protease Do